MDTSEQDNFIVTHLTDLQGSLRLYIQSLMPGDASCKDVCQQTNLTIWKKRSEFTPGTNFKAWIFAIARFEVLNYRKKLARDHRLIFQEELEHVFAEEIAEKSDDTESRLRALQQCLDLLRPKHKELILHRYATPHSLKDYSERTGSSVATLKVTLHRLRSTLLACIERKIKPEAGL